MLRQNRLDKVNAPGNPKAFANGQFMLFTRAAYERIGGHEGVRDALLEDILFAHKLREAGIQIGVHRADSLVRCQMYRDWESFKRGWKRIFIEAAGHRAWYLSRASWKLLGNGAALPLLSIGACALGAMGAGWVSNVALWTGVLGVLGWWVCLGVLWRSQSAPLWSVVLSPLGAICVVGLLRGAASDLHHGRGITWAGMTYQRPVHTARRRE